MTTRTDERSLFHRLRAARRMIAAAREELERIVAQLPATALAGDGDDRRGAGAGYRKGDRLAGNRQEGRQASGIDYAASADPRAIPDWT